MPLKTVANIGNLENYKKLIKADAAALQQGEGVAFHAFTKFTFPDRTSTAMIVFGIIPPTCTEAIKVCGKGMATGTATINAAEEIELEVMSGEVDYPAVSQALAKSGVTRKLAIPLNAPKPANGAGSMGGAQMPLRPGSVAPGKQAVATKPAPPAPGGIADVKAPVMKPAGPKLPVLAARPTPKPVAAKTVAARAATATPSATPLQPMGVPQDMGKPPSPRMGQDPAKPTSSGDPLRPTKAVPQIPVSAPMTGAAKPTVKSAKPVERSPEEKAFRRIFEKFKSRYDEAIALYPDAAEVKLAFAMAMAAARSRDFAGALKGVAKLNAAVDKQQRAEAPAQSKARLQKAKIDKQHRRAARLKETFDAVQKSYFAKGGAESLALGRPNAGAEFQAFLKAQKAFEKTRDEISLKALEEAASAHGQHCKQAAERKDPNMAELARDNSVCETALTAARHIRLAWEYEALPQPPWEIETEMRAAELYTKMIFEQEDGVQYVDERGNPVERAPKVAPPLGKGGINGSFWIEKNTWDENDASSVAKTFIFKPVDAEESVAGFPKGGSAAREMLGKAVGELLSAQMGLDFGVPETTVVAVDGSKVINQTNGRPGKAGTVRTGSIQHFQKSRGDLKNVVIDDPSILEAIPHEEVEKMAVLDFIQLNTDRHEGNFMVGSQYDGPGSKPKLIPIDHGLCLPSIKGLQARRARFGAPAAVLGLTAAAKKKMSPNMVARVQAIDPDEVVSGMKKSFAAIQALHPEVANASQITDANFELTKRSIAFLKKACTELTIEEIQDAYVSSVEEIFTSPDTGTDVAFAQAIQNVKDRKAAFQALSEIPEDQLEDGLQRLGWVVDGFNFASWLQSNPVKVLHVYQNKTENPAAVSKLAGMRQALKDHPAGQKTWGEGLGEDVKQLERILVAARIEKAKAYGSTDVTTEAGDRAEIFEALGGPAKLQQLDPGGRAKTFEAKVELLVRDPITRLGGARKVELIQSKYANTLLKTPYDQYLALKAFKEYEAMGGDTAYSRVGGNGEVEHIVVRAEELKQLAEINGV